MASHCRRPAGTGRRPIGFLQPGGISFVSLTQGGVRSLALGLLGAARRAWEIWSACDPGTHSSRCYEGQTALDDPGAWCQDGSSACLQHSESISPRCEHETITPPVIGHHRPRSMHLFSLLSSFQTLFGTLDERAMRDEVREYL